MVLVASSGLRTVLREAKQLVGVDRGTALRNLLPDLSREISFIRRVKAFLVARSIVSALC